MDLLSERKQALRSFFVVTITERLAYICFWGFPELATNILLQFRLFFIGDQLVIQRGGSSTPTTSPYGPT
jgi:hypothetical protein